MAYCFFIINQGNPLLQNEAVSLLHTREGEKESKLYLRIKISVKELCKTYQKLEQIGNLFINCDTRAVARGTYSGVLCTLSMYLRHLFAEMPLHEI